MFKFYCWGGPFDGATLLLESPTTVVFTARGRKGRYRAGKVRYECNRVPYNQPVALDRRYGHDLIWESHL